MQGNLKSGVGVLAELEKYIQNMLNQELFFNTETALYLDRLIKTIRMIRDVISSLDAMMNCDISEKEFDESYISILCSYLDHFVSKCFYCEKSERGYSVTLEFEALDDVLSNVNHKLIVIR